MNGKNEHGSSASSRSTPYDILSQQLAIGYMRDGDTNNDSGYPRLNSSGEYSDASRTDSVNSLDNSIGSLTVSADYTNHLTSSPLRSFDPSTHSSPLRDDGKLRHDVPVLQRQFASMQLFADTRDDPYINVSRMLVSMRERSATFAEQPNGADYGVRSKAVPSFLPLRSTSYFPTQNGLFASQPGEDACSSRIWNPEDDVDFSASLSSASTPVASAPSLSFPSVRRRTDSESVANAGSIFRQNLINCHRMQALTERLGADWVARAIGFDSETNGVRAPFPSPRRVSTDVASLDLAFGARNQFDPPYVWSGRLPVRDQTRNVIYSCKVFLGGVPWDTDDSMLVSTFQIFGNVRIEWPNRENSASPPRGYVYIIFEHEKQVKHMLSLCTRDPRDGGSYYFFISSKRMRAKEVQVIPWVLADANYIPRDVPFPHHRLDTKRTVFVGALHGVMTAESLFQIMNDIFGDVIYSGIDTDKYKYPIGSGRVTFGNFDAFMRAVKMGYVEVKTPKFTKRLQIEPYLEDTTCYRCNITQGPYFCRDLSCFRYYCRGCWSLDHPDGSHLAGHKVITRTERNTIMRTSVQQMF